MRLKMLKCFTVFKNCLHTISETMAPFLETLTKHVAKHQTSLAKSNT